MELTDSTVVEVPGEVETADDVVAALQVAAGEWDRWAADLRSTADRLEAKARVCRDTIALLTGQGLPLEWPAVEPATVEVPGPPPAPQRRGRPRSGAVPPLEDVAAVANAAIAAGNMPLGALADHFGKPASTVRNWLYRARKARLVDPEPSGVRVIEDHTVPEVPVPMPELQLVADTYREAVTVGRKPIQTIVDRFDATREQAHEWVNLARAAGLLPPRDEPQVPGVLPAGPGGRGLIG